MGFSLEAFLSELEQIFLDQSLDEMDQLDKLEGAVRAARIYAKECNQL